MTHKRLLQMAVAIGGLVPVSAGVAGILLGAGMVDDDSVVTLSLDSHFHYLSGLLLGIGIGFWTCIADIEQKTTPFRLLTAIVFVGGLGRLYALIIVGVPDKAMLFGLTMELAVTPLLAAAQSLVAAKKNDYSYGP